MTFHGRSSRWAAALALGLAGLVGAGAALVLAAPARGAASAFEITVEGRLTSAVESWFDFDGGVVITKREGTFRSRAPFCGTGTFVDDARVDGRATRRFTCDDGTGTLTVLIGQHEPAEIVGSFSYWPSWNTTWQILDGSGSYAGLWGRGSLEGELLNGEITDSGSLGTWRSTFQGVVDRDAVAPTIALSTAKATKLPRPAGAYAVRLGIALRDDVTDNLVSYTLRASAGGLELARRFGTSTPGTFSMTLRVRPPARAKTVRLALTGVDPVGNAVSVRRVVNLPR